MIRSKTKLTPPELAKQWGVDVAKILHWVKSGELKAINIATDRNGRARYAIDVADIAIFEASRSVQPPVAWIRRRRADPNVIQYF
jgi:Uma2 family endonuclease